MSIEKLVQGHRKFQEQVFSAKRELFERLGKGQAPEVLFVTCSDSRIDPAMITQTEPGDLFVVRNAGNMVPAYGAANGGEEATIEFGIDALGVTDIVVCGHSACGAMKGLLARESLTGVPSVAAWLGHAEATLRRVKRTCGHLEGDALLNATIEQNTLVQLENLRSHPAVAAKLAEGKIRMHAWVYHIATGEILAYDVEREQFRPLADVPRAVVERLAQSATC